MNRIKKLIIILALIIIFFLAIPLITVNTVKADAGMLAVLILFFIIYPLLSVVLGIISGRNIKFFWFVPILIAVTFWVFTSLIYQTAFPIVYSAIYFILSSLSLFVTYIINRK